MRSLLVVAAESGAELDRGLASGADALIIDLAEGDGAPSSAASRHRVRDFLRAAQFETHRPLLYVRLVSIEADTVDADLAAVAIGEPDGLVLGRCRSGRDVQQLGAKLAVYEAEYGLTDGEGSIIAEAGSAAESLFAMGSYRDASPRLMALAWDPRSFALDLGSEHHRDADATLTAPMTVARSLTLIGARAAAVAAIDGAETGLDEVAFRADCAAARRDGFNAKVAATPDQVAIINAVFDRGV